MHEHHAIVPNAERTALLVVDAHLPFVRLQEGGVRAALAALEREHHVRATFLRTVRRERDAKDRLKTLLELDCPPAEWRPDPPHAWLALDAVEPVALVPAGLTDGLAEWLAEQLGAPLPRTRAPWARPGWLAQAAAWVGDQVEVRGEPELVSQWPLSSVLRFDTDDGPLYPDGPLYLKAVFALFRHEPAVTAALSREHPRLVPEVVAIDEQAGYMLMRELSGELAGDCGLAACAEAFRTAASIQRAWVGRGEELRALGAPARGLQTLEPYVTRERLALPTGELCARLSQMCIAETIVHGDLHPWNAVVVGDRTVVFDWSDAAVSHPFLDLAPALFDATDDDTRAELVDAYLEPWSDLAPRPQLEAAALVGEALGCVYQAISYQGINDAFEESDRPLFADEPERWKRRAVELAERL
jgi:hypothetical protein